MCKAFRTEVCKAYRKQVCKTFLKKVCKEYRKGACKTNRKVVCINYRKEEFKAYRKLVCETYRKEERKAYRKEVYKAYRKHVQSRGLDSFLRSSCLAAKIMSLWSSCQTRKQSLFLRNFFYNNVNMSPWKFFLMRIFKSTSPQEKTLFILLKC